jgi:hypothetical protein
MKPTPQISSEQLTLRGESRTARARRAFPITDYNFRPSADARSVSALLPGKSRVSELHEFRKLSSDFLGDETSRDYLQEGILFSLIVAVSAWPIISMIGALARLAR